MVIQAGVRGFVAGSVAFCIEQLTERILSSAAAVKVGWVEFGAGLCFGKQFQTPKEYLLAFAVTLVWTCILGALFSILLALRLREENLRLKGALYGLVVWSSICLSSMMLGHLKVHSWTGTLDIVLGLIWGIALVEALVWFEWKAVFAIVRFTYEKTTSPRPSVTKIVNVFRLSDRSS